VNHFYLIEEDIGSGMVITHTQLYLKRENAERVISELQAYYGGSKTMRVVRYSLDKGNGPARDEVM
jgi:hypothetical protein